MKKVYNVIQCAVLAAALAFPCTALADSVDIVFSDVSGFGIDSDTVQINNIRLDIVVVNPFDPTHPSIQSFYYNVPFDFDPVTLHLVPNLGGSISDDDTTACSAATILVTDASTGYPVANAAVTIGSETVFTDSAGSAVFTGLTSGAASVSASASGFVSASRSATLSCATATSLGLTLNPSSGEGAVSANEVRITLAWGENPRDLDSHLTGPNDGTAADDNRFHVYYNASSGEVASLDVDDMYSYGPETITISPPSGSTVLRPGIYRYTVHHYSGSDALNSSGASVTLNLGGTESREFLPPADTTGLAGTSSDTWTVFELSVSDAGAITVLPVNTYASGTGAYSVRSTKTGWGSVENGVDFTRMPRK
ncbi:MAG: carboxypeptidase regulatory-like domain-containing protein [Pseudomonadota bacterium]